MDKSPSVQSLRQDVGKQVFAFLWTFKFYILKEAHEQYSPLNKPFNKPFNLPFNRNIIIYIYIYIYIYTY